MTLKGWRVRVFAATWLCYAGYYFCRKPFYITKAAIGTSLQISSADLGLLGAIYLVAYTLGQFLSGWFGDRTGPRVLLSVGMLTSVVSNLVFGFTNSFSVFAAFMALNGLAQSSGWSGTVGTMANWFHHRERGTVMGFWSTNFQIGGVLANGLAAWALGSYGYRYSFFLGSGVLLAVWGFFVFNQRNRPEDVGLPPVEEPEGTIESETAAKWTRAMVTNVLLVGGFYFFVKFIRYALWSWAPFFLAKNFQMEGSSAGYLSTVFDLCGVAGCIATGVLSDKFFGGRRAGISLLMMLFMLAGCLSLLVFGGTSIVFFTIALGTIGFSLYGPDSLLSGAGAMDIGSKRHATLAAGIINGMGSAGSVVQELIIGKLYDSSGGNLGPVFAFLVGAAALSAMMVGVVVLRNRMGYSQV